MNKKFNKALLSAKKAMAEAKIPFHLHSGTALGAHREQNFISHDSDIDIAIFEKDYNKNLLPSFRKNGFELYQGSSRGRINFGKEITFQHISTGVDLDIFFVYKENVSGKLLSRRHSNKKREIFWVASYGQKCDNMKYKFCRWFYAPYKPVKVLLLGEEYYSMPIKSLVNAYGKDWRIPKKYTYDEGLEQNLYKGLINEA